LARLYSVVQHVEQRIEGEMHDETREPQNVDGHVLFMLEALGRREREGIPFQIPAANELHTLMASLNAFVERTDRSQERGPSRKGRNATLSKGIDVFNLTLVLAILEEEGISKLEPKQVAAAEVLATGNAQITRSRAANACRKWERILWKARKDLPIVRAWLEDAKTEAST
jgi:hypothetical protein